MLQTIECKLLRQGWLVDSILLIIFLTLFYSFYLGNYALFTPDEGRYAEIAREMIATGDYVTPRVNGVAFLDKPILHYWLQVTAMTLFGIQEWAIRFFPMLFGIMGCLMTYAIGRYAFNRRTGLIAAGILATTPLYFGSAHYANLDLEVAVLITATLFLILAALISADKKRSYFFLGAYVTAALAFLTKGLIGVVFPGLILGCWMLLTKQLKLLKHMHLALGAIIFTALILPWYILVQRANPEFLHYFFITQQVTRFLSAATFNNPSPWWFYFPIVFIGAFPWSLFLFPAISTTLRTFKQHSIELFLLLWIIIIFTFFSIPHSKIIGYILPIFPPIALLSANYIAIYWESNKPKASPWIIGALTITACLFAIALVSAPYIPLLKLSPGFLIYRVMVAIILAISALAFLVCFKTRMKSLFAVCMTTNIILLSIIVIGASQLNFNSAKPLTTYLKTVMKPDDEIITYFKYYQDLPIYLTKRITIVANWESPIAQRDNWIRELTMARAFQKTDDWLINEEVFWQRFEGKNRVFVFLNDNYLDQFKARGTPYFYLGRHNKIILLSNQPIA